MTFRLFPKAEPHPLDAEIKSVLEQMRVLEANDKIYAEMLGNLSELCSARALIKPSGPSADAVLTVAGSLIGIGLMLSYEHFHPITSKAIGFILKPKP